MARSMRGHNKSLAHVWRIDLAVDSMSFHAASVSAQLAHSVA
jgi:hypothetical protein